MTTALPVHFFCSAQQFLVVFAFLCCLICQLTKMFWGFLTLLWWRSKVKNRKTFLYGLYGPLLGQTACWQS